MKTKFPAQAIEEYRQWIIEYWSLVEAYENVMPYPDGKTHTYTYKTWNAVRDLITKPAIEKRCKLEAQYPGIGEEYDDRRWDSLRVRECS